MTEDCQEEGKIKASSPVLPDVELIKQGWSPRFVTGPDRLEETTKLYRDIGLEVRAEKIRPDDLLDQCAECQVTFCTSYLMIYTRKPS